MLPFLSPLSISVLTDQMFSHNIWWIFVCSSNLAENLSEGTLQLGALQRHKMLIEI
jgi:hypothetical protein